MGGPHRDTTGWPSGTDPWRFPAIEQAAEDEGFERIGTLGARDTHGLPADCGMAPDDLGFINRAIATSGLVFWHPGHSAWLELSGWLDGHCALRMFSTFADGRILITRRTYPRMARFDGRPDQDPAAYARGGCAPRAGVFVTALPADASLQDVVVAHAAALSKQSDDPLSTGTVPGAVDVLDRFVDHRVVLGVERAFQNTAIGAVLGVLGIASLLFTATSLPVRVVVCVGLIAAALRLPYDRLPLIRTRRIGPPGSPLVHVGDDHA